ncbi:ATP-binding protein (plasmid) [Streptomyces xanthophaeus]|uniref:ATP-binding protein n=1 Tax=Streptomyces xanthophaeus TaxID=67385 RepID=UPI00399024B1
MTIPVLDKPLPRADQPAASARDATRVFLARAARIRAPARGGSFDAVLLVVAELVTNAIRHTDGPCTLHLELRDDSVDVRVADTNPQPPKPRAPHTDGTGGWGWILVNHLATCIHIEPAPGGGKTICAHLPW